MSDNSKQFESASAPSTSKQPPRHRPWRQFPVPHTESDGSKRPKSATATRVEAERDRARNLLPTSHRTRAADFKPGPDNPRDVLRRSTEHKAAPSPFTLPVPCTSRRIVDTAGVAIGPQTFHRRPCTRLIQHQDSKSTTGYQPARLGDRQESLADDAITLLHPPRPQIAAERPGKSYTYIALHLSVLLTVTATARGK